MKQKTKGTLVSAAMVVGFVGLTVTFLSWAVPRITGSGVAGTCAHYTRLANDYRTCVRSDACMLTVTDFADFRKAAAKQEEYCEISRQEAYELLEKSRGIPE